VEHENDEPVGWQTLDPHVVFSEAAMKAGLIRRGDLVNQNLIDFAHAVVEMCASIGDGYGDEEAGANAGEHIRAIYSH
jgi:hypothetical protein